MRFFNKKTVALFVIVGIAVAGAFFVLIKKGVTKKEINKSQQETTKQTQEIDSDAIQKQVTTENGFLETEMLISAEGAIDLIVIDPDKNTITAETIIPSEFEFIRAIPGVLYYSEMEQGRDSNPIIRVYSYRARIGDYTIKIVINPNKAINPAITTSTRAVFWLDFSVGGQSLNLANGTGWADIPMYGYGVRVNTDGSLVAIAPHRTDSIIKTIIQNLAHKPLYTWANFLDSISQKILNVVSGFVSYILDLPKQILTLFSVNMPTESPIPTAKKELSVYSNWGVYENKAPYFKLYYPQEWVLSRHSFRPLVSEEPSSANPLSYLNNKFYFDLIYWGTLEYLPGLFRSLI